MPPDRIRPTIDTIPSLPVEENASDTSSIESSQGGDAAVPSHLLPGEYLATGQYLKTASGDGFLLMQVDGNLVLYRGRASQHAGEPLWSSQSWQEGPGKYVALMQKDGNFVVYRGTDPKNLQEPLWSTKTGGRTGVFFLVLDDDETFSLHAGTGPGDRQTRLWTSHRASVTVHDKTPVIVRRTAAGDERLVYFTVDNRTPDPLTDLHVFATASGQRGYRRALDVPPGAHQDTLWIPDDPGANRVPVKLELKRGSAADAQQANALTDVVCAAWQTLQSAGLPRAIIPRSPTVSRQDLKPWMLRGTNYYPRSHPWAGLWRDMDEAAVEAEFRELDALHINAIRTFTLVDTDAGLYDPDGVFGPELIARVNTLLTVAARHQVKVVLGAVGGALPFGSASYARSDRFFRTGVEPFALDGRILMWDLIDEPGGEQGPAATPELASWMRRYYPVLKQTAPNHLLTVGLAWHFSALADLGIRPDLWQYHEYSGVLGKLPAGAPAQRCIQENLQKAKLAIANEPLFIGEFGQPSRTGGEATPAALEAGEQQQRQIVQWVIEGVEAEPIVGLLNWCAFEFTPDWMGPKERSFGVIRKDGSLKPAGVLLQSTYDRWKTRLKAPWEP